MKSVKHAFLRISEIVSIVDSSQETVVVTMQSGKEYLVDAEDAGECWSTISDIVDPYTEEFKRAAPSRDPFVEFRLK